MQAIERIIVEGYKSIRTMNLTLRPLNVLIGANGVGKSNFVGVFNFLDEHINKDLKLFVAKSGGANTFLHFGRKITDEILIHLDFKQNNSGIVDKYSCILTPTVDDTFIISREVISAPYRKNNNGSNERIVGSENLETLLNNKEIKGNEVAPYLKKAMINWRIYHFHDTSETAKVKELGNIFDDRFLRPDASNLAAYLYLLQETEPGHYQNIVDTIRLVAPFFEDFALRPFSHNEEKIRLEWRERGTDMTFGANALSDGTLRFMSLATLLLQPTDKLPTTILLDEPELGLHPYAITLLANLLQSAAERTQVIVSTQSVTLVNHFDLEDIIVVDREGGQSVFRHLPEDEIDHWLEDYSLGDLWEKNVLGGRPT